MKWAHAEMLSKIFRATAAWARPRSQAPASTTRARTSSVPRRSKCRWRSTPAVAYRLALRTRRCVGLKQLAYCGYLAAVGEVHLRIEDHVIARSNARAHFHQCRAGRALVAVAQSGVGTSDGTRGVVRLSCLITGACLRTTSRSVRSLSDFSKGLRASSTVGHSPQWSAAVWLGQ